MSQWAINFWRCWFLMIWIYFNILRNQLPQVSSKFEPGPWDHHLFLKKKANVVKPCKTLDGSDLQIDIFPHSRDRVASSLNVFEWKFWRVDFHCDGKNLHVLPCPAGCPPRKCFMAPGWGVRAVCSLCNFSTFGPRDLLPIVLQDPNDKYCWWTKSCTTKDDDYPIIYRVLTIPGGAGFRPSTVCWSSLLTIFSHLFLEKCVCFLVFFGVTGKVFSPNGCYFRQSLESFWRACARWANQSWMAIQADLDASPWSMRVNNKLGFFLRYFCIFLLFCTMDSLPSRLLQEGMIFLVHLEPKHLTSKSMQVILRCFLRCFFLFVDIFRLGQICSQKRLTGNLKWDPRKKRLILETTIFSFQLLSSNCNGVRGVNLEDRHT